MCKLNLTHAAGRLVRCTHAAMTAMLLGAEKSLATRRNFKGSVAPIVQSAEERALGGQRMVQDSIVDRSNISKVSTCTTR
ncbi:M20/M25/M40 family metallo-hydrolase [Mesorhizobium sp. M0062]|uniref:M20/M25/M40 family metallo-hydrolase n=1 Tax=Mesorhizobium sp. M0062 TaxID=2956867 RepID=UPI00333BC701